MKSTISAAITKWRILILEQVVFVKDRPGHDRRYAIDPAKIHSEPGWLPETKFADGIKKTIHWYLDNKPWWQDIVSGEYQNYYKKMYGDKLAGSC